MKTNPAPPADQSRIILPHQRHAFDRLVEVTTACFFTARKSLPFDIRSQSLLIGQSGSGKTYLAQAVANHLEVPFLPISVADWILAGCNERGGINTWPAIARFLLTNRRKDGVVICIDELQHACGDSAWERFLRVELFSLLDLRVPRGLSARVDDEDGERTFTPSDLSQIEEVLANRTMIIGAGAFQNIWEKLEIASIGFRKENTGRELPTLKTLTETLPTELINRFRSELLILPPLALSDYEAMLESSFALVPSYLRNTFLQLGRNRLTEVARLRQGTRFLQELLLDTILTERASLRDFKALAPQLELNLMDSSRARGHDP